MRWGEIWFNIVDSVVYPAGRETSDEQEQLSESPMLFVKTRMVDHMVKCAAVGKIAANDPRYLT